MKIKPLDYSKDENWLVKQSKGNKPVDSIWFTPTNDDGTNKSICGINATIKKKIALSYKRSAKAFESFANAYVPLFHQITTATILKMKSGKEIEAFLNRKEIKQDIFACLDYYFKYLNKGKPFILSGICQGTYIISYILSQYMKQHPDYYKRMVVAYAIGGSITKQFLKNNPHVKAAKGELDTGVVVSYNTFPDNNKPYKNMVVYGSPICINPLNWKTDSTYAPAKLNKGYLEYKTLKLKKGLIDAYVNTKKHILITKTASVIGIKTFQYHNRFSNCYHLCEWDLYYQNIKENALKRVKKFLHLKDRHTM